MLRTRVITAYYRDPAADRSIVCRGKCSGWVFFLSGIILSGIVRIYGYDEECRKKSPHPACPAVYDGYIAGRYVWTNLCCLLSYL